MNKVANIDALIASIYNINKVMGIEIFDALADFERIEDLAEMPWSNDEAFSIKAGLQDMQLDGYDIPGSLVERFDIAIV